MIRYSKAGLYSPILRYNLRITYYNFYFSIDLEHYGEPRSEGTVIVTYFLNIDVNRYCPCGQYIISSSVLSCVAVHLKGLL